jgi:hypothetical protein
MIQNLERKSFNQLSRKDKIAIYLQEHPEALTEETMITVAARFMNYSYIRLMIRDIYQHFIQENLEKDNFVIVENYNE